MFLYPFCSQWLQAEVPALTAQRQLGRTSSFFLFIQFLKYVINECPKGSL